MRMNCKFGNLAQSILNNIIDENSTLSGERVAKITTIFVEIIHIPDSPLYVVPARSSSHA